MSSSVRLGRRLAAEFVGSSAGRRGGRLGHRPATLARRCRASADRERRRYRPWTVRHHLDLRRGQRSTFQPGGVIRRMLPSADCVATPRTAYLARPGHRMHRRRRPGQRHVRPSRPSSFSTRPPLHRTTLPRRDRCHRRPGPGHLRPGPDRPRRLPPRPLSAPTSARPTSSPAATSFANPAITIGRMFSDTFGGIAPSSAPGFIAAQLIGGALGFALVRLFYPRPDRADSLGRRRSPPSHGRRRPGHAVRASSVSSRSRTSEAPRCEGAPVIADTTQSGAAAGIGQHGEPRCLGFRGHVLRDDGRAETPMDEVEQGVHVVHRASHVPGHAVRRAHARRSRSGSPTTPGSRRSPGRPGRPSRGDFDPGERVIGGRQQDHRPAAELDPADARRDDPRSR